MFRSYLILTLVLFTIWTPVGMTNSSELSASELSLKLETDTTLVESELTYQLSEMKSADAVIQFQNELTLQDIRYAESLGVTFNWRDGGPVHVGSIYTVNVPSTTTLNQLESIGMVQASSANKQFFTSLDSSVPTTNAPEVWTNLNDDGDSINGTGVNVAVIDTGVNWLHPSFWKASTGELDVITHNGDYYADINDNGVADSTEGPIDTVLPQTFPEIQLFQDYMYIDVLDDGGFSFADGDRWLGGVDSDGDGNFTLTTEKVVLLGESKVAVLYDQENENVYVRGVNLTTMALSVNDYHGHGSHIASTIAGGQIDTISRVGVAPGADLIIIRSLLESGDIIDAIHFAVSNDADIINMSFSSYLGFLDGTDIEDLAITEMFVKNGTICTLAAGNLGGKNKHASFSVASGSSSGASFQVGTPPEYSFLNILWSSTDSDEAISLTTPNDASIEFGPFSTIADSALHIDEDELDVNVFADVSYRGTNRLIVQISDGQFMDSGHWSVTVENPSGDAIFVDAYVWDNEWGYNGLRFTSMTDNTRTISSPATSDFGIAVSAFVESTSIVSSTSSLGPRIDGIPKPEVIAPGSAITAASRSVGSLWSSRSGTSMASPHVAGVLALIRDANDDRSAWLDYSALLQGAGGFVNHYSTASKSFGYGLINAVWSVQHVLSHNFDNETTIAEWSGIYPLTNDPTDIAIDPSLDILRMTAYHDTGILALATAMRAIPDFESTNSLVIEWDSDSDIGTGPSGIDIVVELTNGDVVVTEWNGGSFVTSSLSARWWNTSTNVFVEIEKPTSTSRGFVTVFTYETGVTLADETSEEEIQILWRPLIDSIEIENDDDLFHVTVEVSDIDSPTSDITIGWTSFYENYRTISTSYLQDQVVLSVDVNTTEPNGLHGLLLNVTDGSEILRYPPLILSRGLSAYQRFLLATLDQSQIAVGLLSSSLLTGLVVMDGFLLAQDVYLAFESEFSFWINFTLTGENGMYPISVALAGFSAGEYDVYAVAVNLIGRITITHISTISVVSDNSLLIIGGIGVTALVIVYVARAQLRKRGDV
ncbi:MAG: S8 family serine peptidase [Candidatus Thorarchaeota archaeon]